MQILFYYRGLRDPGNVLAGTSRMFYTLASECAEKHEVVIAGERVCKPGRVGRLHVANIQEEKLPTMLDTFDLFVFSSLQWTTELRKPKGQKWVCFQHCWLTAPFHPFVTELADVITAVSNPHCENLGQRGAPKGKLRCVPNCIDADTFKPAGVQRDEASLVYAGAIVQGKGLHGLVKALPKILERHHGTILHVYGDAAMVGATKGYEEKVRTRSLGLPVQFHGAVTPPELAKAFSRASVLCLPSHMESFGLVAVEAQACGCIPVVHRTGGTPATMKENETGFLYHPNIPDEIAKAVLTALDQAPSMRANAITYARSQFAPDRMMKAWWGIFEELIS